MNFHEVRFPAAISLGSAGGVERRTEVVTLANGFEERNTPWEQSRRRYDAGLGTRTLDDLDAVLAFFEARRGKLYGFRWKDWLDHKSCAPSGSVSASDQVLGLGDGARTEFQLVKVYSPGQNEFRRSITKPVVGTVVVAVDGAPAAAGSDFTVDALSGMVSFVMPPPAGSQVSAGFEFDVPVRFDTDVIEVNLAAFDAGDIPSIPIIEVRV